MNNIKLINNFLRYLTDKGVSSSSLKYYKSDITNFLLWKKDQEISNALVKEYLNSIRLTTPNSTINRRLSTLRSYSQFVNSNFMEGIENVSYTKTYSTQTTTTPSGYRALQERIISFFKKSERVQNTLYKLFFNRPSWYKKYHTYPLANYIHIAILILFSSISGYAVYDQVFYSTDRSLAFPTALERPNRFLSFQGRLTDDLGNPETVATDMVFKLYSVSTGGTALWDSGTCSITPDQDGIFSTLLGSSCGAEISSDVFSENADIWLGVTVAGDAEATPRIQIATVAYALNSETLQGFPAGTGTSTIPYIDSTGTVVLASSSPKIQSTSGTFAVEGQALTITTPNTSNGIITINPDGTGTLDLIFEGAAPGGGANGFVNATNANITSGSLYSGTVASNATGYNFINFLSGVSPTSVFSVQNDGDIVTSGDITIGGGNINTGDIALTIGDGTTDSITFSTDGTGNGEIVLPNDSIGPDEILSTGQTDEYCLTYETGDTFEWQTCGSGGGMTNFIAAGDSGGGQTISDGNTLSILGGTNGIDTIDSATGTVTINLDTTEIGDTTFGSGSGITWTFDASGGTDTTIAFGDNIQTFTTGTAAFTGDLTLVTPGDLIFGGTTSLAETTGATDSGAYLVGVFDEFDYSNSTNVQAVLNDLDAQLLALTTGTSGVWTDAGSVTYLTSVTDDFAIGGSSILASIFGIDESTGNFYFGYDNSANPTFNFEATDGDAGEFGFNTNDSFFFSNANVGFGTTGPDARIDSLSTTGEQLRLTYTDGSVYSGFTVDSNGYLVVDPTGSRIALDGSLQVGSTSPLAYSRFGTNTTGHAGNVTASNDLLISSDLEVDGTFFLDGGTIANSAGTAAVVLSSAPTTTANTLSASNWLVENTANVGQAALMVNQTKDGDLFTASASGTPKFTIQNDGDVVLTNGQLRLGNLASAPTAEGAGSMFFNTTTNTNQCYNGTNWFNCGGTLYSNTNASVTDGSYLTVTHNLATNDLLSSAWINAQGVWKTLESSYQPAIAWEGKDTQKGLYHNNVNSYIPNSETGTGTSTLHEGLLYDTFEDGTKTDSTNTTASLITSLGDDGSANLNTLNQRVQEGRTGLMGGQTFNTSETDNDGQTYLGSNTVNDMYYYDRAKDSTPEVLVELGIDPNWYNGVTLSVATTSASYSQNGTLADKNPNLTTTYNGGLIKATGTDSTPRTIYITIKTPTTFDWTNYQGDSATGVTITPGTAQTLGSTGVSITFTGGINYNVGDVFKIASWYIEPESTIRGAKQQFPERAYVIGEGATSSLYVDIIDADTEKLWMRFSSISCGTFAGNCPLLLSVSSGGISSVSLLNGLLHIGKNGGTSESGFNMVNFVSDSAEAYYSANTYKYNGIIATRNTQHSPSYTIVGSNKIVVTNTVNDVAAAVIPNQPTQEVTVSGWGWIVGDGAAGPISETVNFPYTFQNTPNVTIAQANRTTTTPPTKLEDCITGQSSIYAAVYTPTKSSFVARMNSSTLPSTSYYCYTWTATGVVSPKQFVAVATGASAADGGTTIINETDGSKANVAIGSQTGNAIRSTKVAIANNSLYSSSSTSGPASSIYVYRNIHGLQTETSFALYRSGYYRTGDQTDSWSSIGPTILGTAATADQITSLHVTANTSTIYSGSNTIYVGTTSGLSVIQENNPDFATPDKTTEGYSESSGSVKYYTTDYISEEMIGDIRGMWPLNNANPSSDLEDVSIKANNAAGTNITANGDSVSGVRNTATDFDGSTEYLSCTDAACGGTTKLDMGTSDFSVGAWFKTSTTATQEIIRKGTGTAGEEYYILRTTSSGTLSFLYWDGTTQVAATSTQLVQDGQWHHAVGVADRDTGVKLYLDGQLVAETAGSATNTMDSTGGFGIGVNTPTLNNYWNGSIDEAFVTATALTPGQIKHMYQVGYRALQGHGTGLGHSTFSVDGNQSFGGSSTNVSAAIPDYDNQYMYVATNHISNGALSKIQLNSDTLIHLKTNAEAYPDGDGIDLVSEDITALAVGESLYTIGSATTGVMSLGVEDGYNDNATVTSGNYVSKTYALPKNIGSAVLWVSPVLDANDGSNTITVQASNDGGSNYVTCTLINTNSNPTIPEKEYACTFSTADNDLKVRFQFARGSVKTNTYVTQYGISWLGETGFRVEQADSNNVRLYNFSGETQNLKLNVTGASTAALANPWTDAGSYLYATGYETLRIYDGSGVNYLGLSHDGTLANLTYNGSTVLSINSTGDLLPNTDDAQSLGSDTKRWKDLFLGPGTAYIGTSITDGGTISYNTTNNIFQFDTDTTTNGDIAFFTDDLYLDKSSGSVGINTTTPNISNKLSIVETGSTISGAALVGIYIDANTSGLRISTDDAVSSTEYFLVLRSEEDSTPDNEFLFRTDGTANADGSFTGGGADVAEYYYIDGYAEEGDLVSIPSSNNSYPAGKAVIKSIGQTYDNQVIGIVSTNPGLVAGGGDADINNNYYNQKPIALAGRVPLKVNLENGEIKKGDYLTSSSVPGVAMKATEEGRIIGIALEGYNGSDVLSEGVEIVEQERLNLSPENVPLPIPQNGTGKIMVFANTSWANPNASLASSGDLLISGNLVNGFNVTADGNKINKVGAFAGAVIANIKAGIIEASKVISPEVAIDTISPIGDSNLIIDLDPNDSNSVSKLAIKGEDNKEVASIDSNGNAQFDGTVSSNDLFVADSATISGTLYADDIRSSKIDEIEELLREVEGNQALLAEAQNWESNTATASANVVFDEVQTENLFVTGIAALNSISVTESISFGTDFVFQAFDNSINTLTSPLRIQSLALAPVEIMAGKITIDVDGNTKFEGNVEIAGNLNVNGDTNIKKAIFENLVVAADVSEATESAEIIEGEIVTNSVAGKAILPIDTEEIRINNIKVSDNTLIYVTPISSTQNRVLYVKEKGEGYFKVGFTESLDTEVEFNWWIIELQQEI